MLDIAQWIIERRGTPSSYWGPKGWTSVPTDAIRFVRQQDAEAALAQWIGLDETALDHGFASDYTFPEG